MRIPDPMNDAEQMDIDDAAAEAQTLGSLLDDPEEVGFEGDDDDDEADPAPTPAPSRRVATAPKAPKPKLAHPDPHPRPKIVKKASSPARKIAKVATPAPVEKETKVAKTLKKSAPKVAAKKATAKSPAKPKAKTAAPSRKRTRTPMFTGFPCLCGCGGKVAQFFKRGHVERFDSKIAAIAAGDPPAKHFKPAYVKALGPWKPFGKAGGSKPSRSYRDIRLLITE